LRTSPIALYQRENLRHWLALTKANSETELSGVVRTLFDTLAHGGALFFSELVSRSGLLPSQVEEALSQLAALGLVTSDSFDGLRALLVPSNKRPTFGRNVGKRGRKTNLASIEFAGRWSLLLRTEVASGQGCSVRSPERINTARGTNGSAEDSGHYSPNGPVETLSREAAVEQFARILLHRYGVVFRRLLERESFLVTWYELGRIYRRWEARGEIRGGYFVGGIGGEQFALPEAIGLLRSIRKAQPNGELITLSGADPLNLQGILVPGPRIAALTANRILFFDGLPVAALEAGDIRKLADAPVSDLQIETALKVGKLRPSLRPYYK
jgi:ATP-dependent Lhr-like helicase